jgi:hypothetical protein
MKRKHLLSWLIASVLMFSLSYAWHGVVLNDFNKLSYQKELFLSFLTLLYLVIGAAMTFGYSLIHNKKSALARGTLLGVAAGFAIFLVVFVLGTSLTGGRIYALHASIDLIWQILEQAAGGFAIAYVFHYIEQREMIFD